MHSSTARIVGLLVATTLVLATCSEDDGNNRQITRRTFAITIENISDQTPYPTPIAPPLAVLSSQRMPIVESDTDYNGSPLETMAENGEPTGLEAEIDLERNTRTTSADLSIAPGDTVRLKLRAPRAAKYLSVAGMYLESNDTIIGTESAQNLNLLSLAPNEEGTLSGEMALFDVGTEHDGAFHQGVFQPPRQPSADAGSEEGVISPFTHATRALPRPSDFVDISVEQTNGFFDITIDNVSRQQDTAMSPIAPVFYAVHGEDYSLFEPGTSASDGLESLAEDGSPVELVQSEPKSPAVLTASAEAVTEQPRGVEPGPAAPDESYELTVEPNEVFRYLTFATMVLETNDAFISNGPTGVELMDRDGNPRSSEAITDDLERTLGTYDAGTEANEVPGVGPHQAPRQIRPNSGPPDPNDAVRTYLDSSTDLTGDRFDKFFDIDVNQNGGDALNIILTNTSEETIYPTPFKPVTFAIHSEAYSLFNRGMEASDGLELVAETGKTSGFIEELSDVDEIVETGVADMADGSAEGHLPPGSSYSFTVRPDRKHRYLSFVSMIAQSNDAFLAVDPGGVALADSAGNLKSLEKIESDLEDSIRVWDAGTERNQAGAIGPDQAPRQISPDSGDPDGPKTATDVSDLEAAWNVPDPDKVLRIRVERLE
jgi:hypothetical protein